MTTTKQQLQVKIERIHAARMKVEEFVAAGGDLKSKEAIPFGLELVRSYKDLFREFDPQVLDEANVK